MWRKSELPKFVPVFIENACMTLLSRVGPALREGHNCYFWYIIHYFEDVFILSVSWKKYCVFILNRQFLWQWKFFDALAFETIQMLSLNSLSTRGLWFRTLFIINTRDLIFKSINKFFPNAPFLYSLKSTPWG